MTRRGLLWSGSLVTRRLPGRTLAERLDAGPLDARAWAAVGRCIARFHVAGIRHADLNAHNVMLDGDGTVFLIDFDRASRRASGPGVARWRTDNLRRLRRSLAKLADRGGRAFDEAGHAVLERAWRDGLG